MLHVLLRCCRGARGPAPPFAEVFVNQGAASFVGYTDYVSGAFAVPRGTRTFSHLIAGGAVGSYPSVGDVEQDSSPAAFKAFHKDPTKTLAVQCQSLGARQLLIEYTWPVNMWDLDTGTMFDGQQLGFGCQSGVADITHTKYMSWSGDDTSAGGKETVLVDLLAARADGLFTSQMQVQLRAAWYSSDSSGPATVTVSLVDPATGVKVGAQQASITPNRWSGCGATQWVGAVTAQAAGASGSETVSFDLQPGEPPLDGSLAQASDWDQQGNAACRTASSGLPDCALCKAQFGRAATRLCWTLLVHLCLWCAAQDMAR